MLTVVVWDVQHGSACYVRTPENLSLMIDLGTGSYSHGWEDFSPLLHLKREWGVEQLDEVIVTHPHADHIADIINFDMLSPRVLRRPQHLTDEEVRQGNPVDERVEKYLEVSHQYTRGVDPHENPEIPANNGGVTFRCFHPSHCGRSNLNNHSIVTVIEYLGAKVIVPGDNEPASWNELLENEQFVSAITDADVLVAPHHGRESGFCPAIFECFTPYLVIVSDAAGTESSAVQKYSQRCKGWHVRKRSGGREKRYCLTTRKDGPICLRIGENQSGETAMEVEID